MGSGGPPSWERLAFWLIAFVVGLEVLVSALPRLVGPLSVLIAIAVIARLIWFFTDRRW